MVKARVCARARLLGTSEEKFRRLSTVGEVSSVVHKRGAYAVDNIGDNTSKAPLLTHLKLNSETDPTNTKHHDAFRQSQAKIAKATAGAAASFVG